MSEIVPLLSPTLTRREARAVLRHGIAAPLFVPDMGGNVVKLLIAGSGPKLLADELHRLAILGSTNAAALLTLLGTRGAIDSGDYAEAALERCRTAAAAGQAYAQYVMGWVNMNLGKYSEAFRCFNSSARGLFLPAFIDAARYVAGGTGDKARDHPSALKIFWAAHKMGHRAALTFIARYWIRGAAGGLARLAGLLLYFPALLRQGIYAARHPLSEKAFILPLKGQPLLRAERN